MEVLEVLGEIILPEGEELEERVTEAPLRWMGQSELQEITVQEMVVEELGVRPVALLGQEQLVEPPVVEEAGAVAEVIVVHQEAATAAQAHAAR